MSRQPRVMMRQRFDYYAMTYPLDNCGTEVATPPATPTVANVACYYQEATSSIIETYKQRNERAHGSIYTCNGSVYAAIQVKDQCVLNGNFYRVVGKVNLSSRNTVYRVDVSEVDT